MSADYDPTHPPANPIGSYKATSARGLTWNISQWQFARSRNRHPQEVDVPEPDVSAVTVPPTLKYVFYHACSVGVPATAPMPTLPRVPDQTGWYCM
jgi:hypothetical protein